MVKAAPVLWDKQVVENSDTVKAIAINSGIANACTGKLGEEANEKLDETTNMFYLINKIELYSLLMKIKYSDNREKIIDETLKVTRFLLTNVMDVKEESLNEIDECFSK